MLINDDLLNSVTSLARELGPSEQLIFEMRKRWPNVHFTYCFDDDICDKTPAREDETFNLYYVDGSGHCMSLTPHQEAATGLVIAEVEPE